ncbi:NADH-quinone oxidoreductase subunit A [Dermacoccus sp. CCH2-D9]|uniref:NADH-quinone oxidoreductase subunit A n=1 Tax=Dermacoccus sp. CCH2-D9 TaxID=1768779 RepID=UPI0009ECC420|nr:NADH-quinone oxidoreductase subunit A [Dermacoccus sp. CCH2-D9]
MNSGLLGYLVVLGVTLGGVALFVAAMVVRRVLAPRVPSPTKLTTYESGVDPIAGNWQQSGFRYVAFAFLYVVFAVDAVYLFPWALVLRTSGLGVASLLEMGIFILVLLVGLAHAARRGLLAWL